MKVNVKRILSGLMMVVAAMVATSCSQDGPSSNGGSEGFGASGGNNSFVGKWKKVWDYTQKPTDGGTIQFTASGKMTMTAKVNGVTRSATGTYRFTDKTIIMSYPNDGYEDEIYYRMMNGKLYTYDDYWDYSDDPDGTATHKIIWERVK